MNTDEKLFSAGRCFFLHDLLKLIYGSLSFFASKHCLGSECRSHCPCGQSHELWSEFKTWNRVFEFYSMHGRLWGFSMFVSHV
jgi:hypothetical protein